MDYQDKKYKNTESLVQRVGKNAVPIQDNREHNTIQRKANNTGLPDNLKSGIENLSGYSMDDVKVHYNSNKPAQLNAHAYAQGTNIHLASGQEKHLPHEVWHVVQQKQGRVQPTTSFNGAAINDNIGLEKEADVMGGKALQLKNVDTPTLVEKSVSSSVSQLSIDLSTLQEKLKLGFSGWNPKTNDSTGRLYEAIKKYNEDESDENFKRILEIKKSLKIKYYKKYGIALDWLGSKLESEALYLNDVEEKNQEDLKTVRKDGNKTPRAYEESDERIIASTTVHMKTWEYNIPTLSQFEKATYKLFARRSSDPVVDQIDGLLNKFNQLRKTPNKMNMQKELVQEMLLACEFWLKKVNKSYTGKKPKAATNGADLGDLIKLKGEEERRAGILALRVSCSHWLTGNGHFGSLDGIVNSRAMENQGVTKGHDHLDQITWNRKRGHVFPQPNKRDNWEDSQMGDFDYDVLQNDDQKRTAKLVFRGGIAYRWQEVLNPDSKFGVYNSNGEKTFAMDKRGRIYSGTSGGIFFHSSLLGFADALSAGMMTVQNGRIVEISNASGHYKPPVEAMVRVLRQLQRYGVNVSNIKVERVSSGALKSKTFTGAQMLASDHSKWPDQ